MKKAFFIVCLFILGCSQIAVDEREQYRQEILDEFEDIDQKIPEQKPVNISDDPKKQEVMDFVKNFFNTINYQSVDDSPVRPNDRSFQFAGFLVEDTVYSTVVTFRLNSLQGPTDKQYRVIIEDLGEGKYKLLEVEEEK
ncbi:hypothetical protein GOV09_00715 [Candidatus Woesearchaeota archaeon]|nr:hypothetical protein [Candidatus Woesearchaeota archaeon]